MELSNSHEISFKTQSYMHLIIVSSGFLMIGSIAIILEYIARKVLILYPLLGLIFVPFFTVYFLFTIKEIRTDRNKLLFIRNNGKIEKRDIVSLISIKANANSSVSFNFNNNLPVFISIVMNKGLREFSEQISDKKRKILNKDNEYIEYSQVYVAQRVFYKL